MSKRGSKEVIFTFGRGRIDKRVDTRTSIHPDTQTPAHHYIIQCVLASAMESYVVVLLA